MITIFPPPGAFPRPSGFRSLVSDSEGRYVIGEVPHQHSVVLKAASPHPRRLQPCAAALTMGADGVSTSSSSPPRRPAGRSKALQPSPAWSMRQRPPKADGPLQTQLSGTKQCVGRVSSRTHRRTDANGRYELCRLPSVDIVSDGCVVAFADGRSSWSGLLNPRTDMIVDINLPRLALPRVSWGTATNSEWSSRTVQVHSTNNTGEPREMCAFSAGPDVLGRDRRDQDRALGWFPRR